MIKINFPKDKVVTRKGLRGDEIFDPIRKKYFVLTPEEWVRQNMIQYLLISKKYPASLISVEKEIRLGELRKRYDLVIYDRQVLPWMIIECKEMKTSLSERTLDQVLRYHAALPVTFLVITNGSYSIGFEKIDDKFIEINEFPDFL